LSASIQNIADGDYCQKDLSLIHGTGYVVQSLEAALWCFYHTSTFEAAILQAANLGDDADTTAAICGQIAGAYYGESNIPAKWLERLHMRAEVSQFADQLAGAGA
jgi:ADP-ribosyl-[dinitrogen reductase] hydrolase